MDGFQVVMLGSGLFALLLGVLGLGRSRRIARLLHTIVPEANPQPAEWPRVSVLAPCRGVDVHFEAYARALLTQEYPSCEVLFLLESTTDPAWEILSRVLGESPGARAALVVTGTAEGRSQKVHNLLAGLDRVEAQSTILTFVDSDAQVHSRWLKALVRPLEEPSVGATSGFRWYVPCGGSGASSLRSAWNAASLGFLISPRWTFAWGGSSAIRRETFEKLRIREAWSHGLSDDLLLTQAVRGAGLSISFIPAALVPTVEPCTWRALIEWTNRQATITRVYAPHLWRAGLFVQLLNFMFGVLALVAVVAGQWLSGGWLLSYWVCSGIGSMQVCRAARHRLAAHGYHLEQRAWPQLLWPPMVTALSLVSLAVSLTRRTITWRGISYTMLSPSQVVVHRRASLSVPPLSLS